MLLKSKLRSMINTWGLKNILSALIDVLRDRGNDEYITKLCDNLTLTLSEYEARYIVDDKDIRFEEGQ